MPIIQLANIGGRLSLITHFSGGAAPDRQFKNDRRLDERFAEWEEVALIQRATLNIWNGLKVDKERNIFWE